ncbi:MAG: DUF397 domain-containing protein [Pseudonocardiaceae bacterium]
MNHADTMSALADPSGWKTSTRTSQGENCVEVTTAVPGWIGVRDTKNRTAGLLTFNRQQWDTFLHAINEGQFGQAR